MNTQKPFVLLDPALLKPAIAASFTKLSPRVQWRNPVMFVVYIGSILTTLLGLQALQGQGEAPAGFIFGRGRLAVVHRAVRQLRRGAGRGPQQGAGRLAAQPQEKHLGQEVQSAQRQGFHGTAFLPEQAENLRKGAVVLVEAGDMIPLDGEVIEGVASVDESAITGESAPVVRESGGDFSAVTGGTRVLSDWLVVRIVVNPGESFLDRMISMVEGAKRQKTPNEIALTILLVALTIVFLVVTVTLLPFSMFSVEAAGAGTVVSITALVALLVCLIPTTIGGLLSAVGVAGMSRMMQANVIATSGRAVEAAGDVDVLLLDKTGTITHGNRQASSFLPAPGVTGAKLATARCRRPWPMKHPKAAASWRWPSAWAPPSRWWVRATRFRSPRRPA
jgi:K+-transporting ATPase ATPase B chain